MFSVRLYIHILLHVLLIVLVTGAGLAGILSRRAVILGCAALLAAAWLIGSLVHSLNSFNRKIRFFLDSIADNESMFYFPENAGNREQRHLQGTFNRFYALMAACKKKEFERELYRKEYESWEKLMRVLTHEIMNSITPVVSLSGTLLSYFQGKNRPDTLQGRTEITEATIRKTIRGLETIKSQGENLMYFTESYRQFACLKQPEQADFPLPRLLQNIRLLFQEEMSCQQIDFSIHLFQPEITLHADEKMLSQVLINLLKNAMQALAGQPRKTIRLKVGRKGNLLLIQVADNGPGIPSNLTEDIFIPFFTTKPGGSGIGLSLSRQIIRLHGGDLSVSSQPYCQTTFTISLPVSIRPNRNT